jgi:predicted AlkP superfamily phosphohydrolase/phosphomutase
VEVRTNRNSKKVAVIGLDGVSENVLEAVGWERLPNLKRLLKEGTSGKLESVLPPMTAQAWATFATGRNLGKHGADNFFLPEGDLNTTKIVSSEDIAGKTVYEILEEASKRCVLVNLPVAYPFRVKKGVAIASFLAGGDDWYYPADLKEKVKGMEEYRLFPDTFLEFGAGREKYAKEVREIARARFNVARQLWEKELWDWFFLLFSETDWIQHRELAALEEGKIPVSSEVIKLYQDVDKYVGWFQKATEEMGITNDFTATRHAELGSASRNKLGSTSNSVILKRVQDDGGGVHSDNEGIQDDGALIKDTKPLKTPKGAVMILLSDHGFKVYRGKFYVNKWLMDQGWLTVAPTTGDKTQPQVVARNKLAKGGQEGVLSWVFKMGGLAALNLPMLRRAAAATFRLVSKRFPQQLQRDLTDFSDMDLGCVPEKTLAYSMPGNFGGIYLNTKERFANGVVGKGEAEKLKREIKAGLERLRDPVTNLPAVKKVYLREELYHGERLEAAPEIICEPGEFWIKPSVSVKEVFGHGPVSSHAREGVVAVWGGRGKNDAPETRHAEFISASGKILKPFSSVQGGQVQNDNDRVQNGDTLRTRRKDMGTVRLEDLAPTILKLMGVKVPQEMDGKAIRF